MKSLMKSQAVFILFTAVLLTNAFAADLLIKNARLIDGTGALPKAGVSILIRGGLIAAIGDNASAEGVQVLDADNATVLPGLIDSHVHLFWGPGGFKYGLTTMSTLKNENGVFDLAAWRSMYGLYTPQYLRAYLACGVTTVLDAASAPEVITEIRSLLDSGNPGPRFLALGPGLAAPGGYGDGKNHVTSNNDITAQFAQIDTLGTSGVKVFMESGWDFATQFPTLSAEARDNITMQAEQRHLPIFVHASSEQDQLDAVSMGAHALMHPVIMRDSVLSDSAISRIAETQTYQVTTLMWAGGGELTFFEPLLLKDSLLDQVVPASELADARNPFMRWSAKRTMIKLSMWGQPLLKRWSAAINLFLNKNQCNKWLSTSQESLRLEHEAGVKLVVGSDSPYGSTALFSFHGPSTLREIELLGESGITPMEAIKAATINAAEMLGLDKEIGTVEVGKKAELVIVRDDPLKDLANLRSILYTVQGGVAKTPEQWMSE